MKTKELRLATRESFKKGYRAFLEKQEREQIKNVDTFIDEFYSEEEVLVRNAEHNIFVANLRKSLVG